MGKNNLFMPHGLRFGPKDGLHADLPMKHHIRESWCVWVRQNELGKLGRGIRHQGRVVARFGACVFSVPSRILGYQVSSHENYLGGVVEH